MTISSNDKTAAAPKKIASSQHASIRVITLVITLIALGCALYAIFTNTQLHLGSSQQIKQLTTQVASLTLDQKNTQQQLNEALTTLSTAHKTVSSMQEQLQTALKQHLYQSKDWLLLKVRYYLELAEINAHWTDNSEATIALLQQADALLADIHDPRFFAVRQHITQELIQLKALPALDITGLLSQLDAAQTAILQLPLKPTLNAVEKTQTTSSSSTWRARLKESMRLLGQLVVVRRHDGEILPIPSQAYEQMLREGIQLNLQETQWAVLQHNDAVYQFSLTQAIKHIERSFDLNKPDTKALIKELQQLQSIHLLQQKPLLGQSLPLLNQLIETKDKQRPTPAGDNE